MSILHDDAIERLNETKAQLAAVTAERDEYQHRLSDAVKELQQAQADLEQAQAERDEAWVIGAGYHTQLSAVMTERDRYAEALDEIANHQIDLNHIDWRELYLSLRNIARHALE